MLQLNRRLALMVAAGLVATTALTSPTLAREVKTLAIIVPEQGTDFSWNQEGVDAARAAAEAAGIEVIVAEGMGYGDIRPTLRELVEDGADLIIAHAAGYNTSAPEIAEETGVPVAIPDKPDAQKANLVADYTTRGTDAAYLAGMLAAKMTRTNTIGIVVAAEPIAYNVQSAGFVQGVRAVDPAITIRYAVVGPAGYNDAVGGRRVTESVIASGADIIFGQGNESNFGMIDAVENAKAADGGKVTFIDVIGDKSSIASDVLLSAVSWDLTPVFAALVADLQSDTFGTRSHDIKLADDSLSLLKTPMIPEEIWTELMAERQKLIDGSLDVETVEDAAAVRALMSAVDAPAE